MVVLKYPLPYVSKRRRAKGQHSPRTKNITYSPDLGLPGMNPHLKFFFFHFISFTCEMNIIEKLTKKIILSENEEKMYYYRSLPRATKRTTSCHMWNKLSVSPQSRLNVCSMCSPFAKGSNLSSSR